MNKKFENTYHEVEAVHWWFVARRTIVKELVRKAASSTQAAILEIGCSGGPLMESLRDDGFSNLFGIDISPEAVALCLARRIPNVSIMDAQAPDFPAASFDVITASDVLEHLSDGPGALAEWYKLLRPGGTLIVFVPAFNFLWSGHDEINHHFRRYRAADLARLLHSAGFEIRRQGYWNFSIFFPVALVRLAKRLLSRLSTKPSAGDLKPIPFLFNQVLIWLLNMENKILLAGVNFPWGVSATVVARKPPHGVHCVHEYAHGNRFLSPVA